MWQGNCDFNIEKSKSFFKYFNYTSDLEQLEVTLSFFTHFIVRQVTIPIA